MGQQDNSTILDAINKLQKTLDTDFAQLGDLIQQQTQIIVDTVNRDGMALALSNSDKPLRLNSAFDVLVCGYDWSP